MPSRRTSVCVLLAFALLALAQASAQRSLVLSTSDARIALVAGPSRPRLAALSRSACAASGAAWGNSESESLPAFVEINGVQAPVTWSYNAKLSTATMRRVVAVYDSADPHLRLRWEWEARARFGAFEHRITIENLSRDELWLPMVDSLALTWRSKPTDDLRNFYVEKGAGTPSAQGTHLEPMLEGYRWTGYSSTYALDPAPGRAAEIIPAEIVFNAATQCGWYAGIEFSGRTRIALERNAGFVRSVLGLNPEPGPFRTRLAPGGSFTTPTVFLGAFSGGPEGAGNQLRPWVRTALGNPIVWRNPSYPFTVNNSWGSGMGVDEPLALRMIGDSKNLGLEMFHIDAGWFRGVGDWAPDPKKFPHGLAYIADAAHRQGLRFGIWVDWTQAALNTAPGALNVRDPKVRNWLVADVAPDWKPEEFKGQTIDLGAPAAHDWAAKEVNRLVSSYHLDMLEHDGYLVAQGCTRDNHPHAPPNHASMKVVHDMGADFVYSANETDVSYHAVRAYYDIYEKTRRAHPGLLFEVCNDGGRMVDFGSAAHADYFSITDTYDPLSNRRAFYDTSHLLPAAMLESYVEKWPTPHIENLRYMLRSGMMGWVTLMLDTTVWTPQQHEAAEQAIALYKRELRPLIRQADLYHVSARPDGEHWDGMEYWDPAQGKGAVFVFRGSTPVESAHRFQLAGLKPAARYQLHFQDGSSPDRTATGRELMQDGLKVALPMPLSSEIVFVTDEAGAPVAPRGHTTKRRR